MFAKMPFFSFSLPQNISQCMNVIGLISLISKMAGDSSQKIQNIIPNILKPQILY